ncbi:hypothetical protein C8F01DRAFT_1068477 [Mycena amicta]|nr:hypothetical protein C8F01DRAFT_1239235 [Mycena amicta]KAJ7049885.1 hypothetical protein C8F01DRAFT_1068477 [Mycena amicta]
MSSSVAVGYFCLSAGVRVESKNTSNYSIFHVHYSTALKTDAGQFLSAKLRVYSGPTDTPLPNDTLAFVVAKIHAPADPSESALIDLEAINVYAIPGDVTSDAYYDSVPDVPTFLFITGHVPSTSQPQAPGLKSFGLAVAEYIGGGMKQFDIQAVFPATPRWRNTPIPRALNCTNVVGVSAGRSPEGLLRVNIEHIALNLGPHVLSPAADTNKSPAAATPTRTRKYQSSATPTAPAQSQPVASTSQIPLHSITSMTPAAPNTPMPQAINKRRKGKGYKAASPAPDVFEDDDEDEEEEDLGKGKRQKKPRHF